MVMLSSFRAPPTSRGQTAQLPPVRFESACSRCDGGSRHWVAVGGVAVRGVAMHRDYCPGTYVGPVVSNGRPVHRRQSASPPAIVIVRFATRTNSGYA